MSKHPGRPERRLVNANSGDILDAELSTDKLVEPQMAVPGAISSVLYVQPTTFPQEHEHSNESNAVERKAKIAAAESELNKHLPDVWRIYLIPLFFAVSIFSVNLLFMCRHFGSHIFTPYPVNALLLGTFLFCIYCATSFCNSRFSKAQKELFSAGDATAMTELQNLKNVDSKIRDALTTLPYPPRFAFLKNFLLNPFYLAFTGLLMIGLPICLLFLADFAGGLAPGLDYFVIFAVAGSSGIVVWQQVKRQERYKNWLRNAYLYASLEPKLIALLKRDLIGARASEIVIEYDAFADIQRWFKLRFSQKSWKKTAFIALLVIGFICFDGLSVLSHSIAFITGILTSNAVLTAGTAGGAGGTTGFAGLHLFSNLIALLSFGGFAAYWYAICQPTHLRLSADGLEFLYNRKQFGGKNIKRVAWKNIREMRLVARHGTTLVGDKQLSFEGDRGSLLKFKLNCVDSISSREMILSGIEKWAPTLKRDADVIQLLQRPAEQSYTDLWLQTLASPPRRSRLEPLVTQSVLQDGRYVIVRELGLGGQGTAYLALDARSEKTVVLKEFILPIYVDVTVRKSALQRFENEARILQKLNNDQIVKLTDFFVEDHRGYLALDYIQGVDLKKFVEKNGKMTEADIIPLALQMCGILEYLHKQDPPVIHRDFTPDNLILQPDGRLMLIDFNVAQQTSATVTGTIVGKQCYLPPEQFQGEPVVQSDIYSMGATIYFLCTGKDPEAISQSHPQNVESSISQALDAFVSNCTTIDPDLRFKNAAECAKDLSSMVNLTELH